MTRQDIEEAKAFFAGTVRSWKRGQHRKMEGGGWQRMKMGRPAPLASKVPEVQQSTLGGNTYVSPASPAVSEQLEALRSLLDEKIQSPSNPKGRAAYTKSLGAWSKAASKVAQSYADKGDDMKGLNDSQQAMQSQLLKLLQSVSGNLAQVASLAEKLK